MMAGADPAHQASFRFDCPVELRSLVEDALRHELEEGPEGTTAHLQATDSGLSVTIEAEDVSGLRAACNNMARLVDVSIRSMRV